MKQSPIRRIRRDRSRLVQELSLALGTGDKAKAAELETQISDFDKQIAIHEAKLAREAKAEAASKAETDKS